MLISLVIPCFNEEDNLEEVYNRITCVIEKIDGKFEIIFINDGSTDNSHSRLVELSLGDSRIKVLELSRNFGHQAAISAGLDYARGDAVIMMDADLQQPPELIPSMIGKWMEGYEVVYTIRNDPPGTTAFKKITAKVFYKLMNLLANIQIPENSADFRLLDRKVLEELNSMNEKTKFFRGLVNWVGFKQCPIYYDAAPRFGGETKYSIWKMVKFAFDGITSFSAFPLHLSTIIGVLVSFFCFFYSVYAIYIRLLTHEALPGWTSVLVAVLFLGGVQLLSLGIIGEYLNRIYKEVKARPTYIVRNIIEK